MAYEVEVTISFAKDLKNVNWRHGSLKPYAVVWVDPAAKCSTKVDRFGDTSPAWHETLVIPLRAPIENSTLSIDVVHADAAADTKPLIGLARVPLRNAVDDVSIGGRSDLKLKLKRPSGRPQGKLEVKVMVRQPDYRAPNPYYDSPYGVPPPKSDYGAPHQYINNPYGVPPPTRDYGAPQQYNDPYGSHYNPNAGYSYQAPQYNQGQQGGYGCEHGSHSEKKQSKYGLGTGLAVGAVAGVLGGLAIAEGVGYFEDKIAEDVAEKVEDDNDSGEGDYGDNE